MPLAPMVAEPPGPIVHVPEESTVYGTQMIAVERTGNAGCFEPGDVDGDDSGFPAEKFAPVADTESVYECGRTVVTVVRAKSVW